MYFHLFDASNEDFLLVLFGFVALLTMIIFGVIVASAIRRSNQQNPLSPPPTEPTLGDGLRTVDRPADVSTPVDPGSLAEPVLVPGATPLAEAPAAKAIEKDVDLRDALRSTEQNFFGRLRSLFTAQGENTAIEDVEEVLYTSDLGPKSVQSLMGAIEDKLSRKELRDPAAVRETLRERMLEIFAAAGPLDVVGATPLESLRMATSGPTIIMIVGVNGAGKTTSIGKLAARFAGDGKRVLVAAGDTFRAAAGAQLKAWTERAQVEIFFPEGVSEPAAVAFDAVSKARAQNYDVVLIDTAGRLHTQANLMEELKKVKRVIQKLDAAYPHETLIVLDANSGQNALLQAKEFNKTLELTGCVLTKMDGTAKGGVALGLVAELGIPVKMIGVGERIRDLRSFSPREFVDSILGG